MIFTATDFWFLCPMSQLLLPDNRLCDGPSSHAANCIKHLAIVEKPTPFRRALNQLPDWIVGTAAALVQKGLFPPTPHNARVRAVIDRREFIRRRLNKLPHIIAPSRTMQQMLLRNGIDPDRITHLPYGIDRSQIQRAPGKARGEKLRVGFIGTLAPHKAPHLLIQAARQIPQAPMEFLLHGAGPAHSPYPDQLRSMAAGDPRIQFRGSFQHHEISEILSALDVLVVPSIWHENTPLVVQEAQAAGCAVVASDRGGLSELIRDGIDGLLFPAGDFQSLARQLLRLCEDRDFAPKLAAAAPQPMSLKEHVDRLEVLYLKKN
jgi:glycosyltransferase involved in cell wall biosynthesis